MPLPSDALTIENLLRIAAQDLGGAKRLAAAGNRNAPYLCQQAAVKVARAGAASGGRAPRPGALHRRDRRVPSAANPMQTLLKTTGGAAPYVTTYRYPRSAGRVTAAPSANRMALLIDRTEAALLAATRVFGVDLEASDEIPAANATPVRDLDRAPAPLNPDA